jgi:hypothetical protein
VFAASAEPRHSEKKSCELLRDCECVLEVSCARLDLALQVFERRCFALRHRRRSIAGPSRVLKIMNFRDCECDPLAEWQRQTRLCELQEFSAACFA